MADNTELRVFDLSFHADLTTNELVCVLIGDENQEIGTIRLPGPNLYAFTGAPGHEQSGPKAFAYLTEIYFQGRLESIADHLQRAGLPFALAGEVDAVLNRMSDLEYRLFEEEELADSPEFRAMLVGLLLGFEAMVMRLTKLVEDNQQD